MHDEEKARDSEVGCLRVLRLNMRENVVIEEFQDHRDAVGEDQILANVFELDGPELAAG